MLSLHTCTRGGGKGMGEKLRLSSHCTAVVVCRHGLFGAHVHMECIYLARNSRHHSAAVASSSQTTAVHEVIAEIEIEVHFHHVYEYCISGEYVSPTLERRTGRASAPRVRSPCICKIRSITLYTKYISIACACICTSPRRRRRRWWCRITQTDRDKQQLGQENTK